MSRRNDPDYGDTDTAYTWTGTGQQLPRLGGPGWQVEWADVNSLGHPIVARAPLPRGANPADFRSGPNGELYARIRATSETESDGERYDHITEFSPKIWPYRLSRSTAYLVSDGTGGARTEEWALVDADLMDDNVRYWVFTPHDAPGAPAAPPAAPSGPAAPQPSPVTPPRGGAGESPGAPPVDNGAGAAPVRGGTDLPGAGVDRAASPPPTPVHVEPVVTRVLAPRDSARVVSPDVPLGGRHMSANHAALRVAGTSHGSGGVVPYNRFMAEDEEHLRALAALTAYAQTHPNHGERPAIGANDGLQRLTNRTIEYGSYTPTVVQGLDGTGMTFVNRFICTLMFPTAYGQSAVVQAIGCANNTDPMAGQITWSDLSAAAVGDIALTQNVLFRRTMVQNCTFHTEGSELIRGGRWRSGTGVVGSTSWGFTGLNGRPLNLGEMMGIPRGKISSGDFNSSAESVVWKPSGTSLDPLVTQLSAPGTSLSSFAGAPFIWMLAMLPVIPTGAVVVGSDIFEVELTRDEEFIPAVSQEILSLSAATPPADARKETGMTEQYIMAQTGYDLEGSSTSTGDPFSGTAYARAKELTSRTWNELKGAYELASAIAADAKDVIGAVGLAGMLQSLEHPAVRMRAIQEQERFGYTRADAQFASTFAGDARFHAPSVEGYRRMLNAMLAEDPRTDEELRAIPRSANRRDEFFRLPARPRLGRPERE